jgi:UDP-N-acetylglucosamine 2-epimerase (non-hydrolysing)
VYVTGNPIFEVLTHYDEQISASDVVDRLGLEPGRYFLVTCHRAENVDIETRFRSVAGALGKLAAEYGMPVIVSVHPRTAARLSAFGIAAAVGVRLCEPFGLFDFVKLERHAFCVLTDSGTVQEECAVLGVPNVTIRDSTERPETIECGSNTLSGVEEDSILTCVRVAVRSIRGWSPPPEYIVPRVSDTVLKIVVGYR